MKTIAINEIELKNIISEVVSCINEKKKKEKDFWEKHGIKKQTIPGHKVQSIGFSEEEQKWYGWSHRAIYGFGVGSKVKKGDCAYNGKEWTAKNLEDAKKMAIDFAEAVSESYEHSEVLPDIEYDGCCGDINIYEWERRMKGKRPFSYNKLLRMIKVKYPDFYEEAGLEFPNPYCKQTYQTPNYYILTHSAIEYFFKKVNLNESTKKQTWRDNPWFTIGQYKGMKKIDIINENPDYCLWLHRKTMEQIDNTPFSPKELALLDIAYYKKHKEFPIRSPYTPRYAKINGKYVSQMSKDELQYVYEHGNESFKWIVKQEHMNRGWEKRNWHDIKKGTPDRYDAKRGAPAFQSDDVGDEAWKNN